MAEMSKYCKAYYVKRFREYPGWDEHAKKVKKERKEEKGEEIEIERDMTDEDFLYLHDSYIVTDGIFVDEDIIFDQVTDEWKEFCHKTLEFEIPVYEPVKIPEAEGAEGEGGGDQPTEAEET